MLYIVLAWVLFELSAPWWCWLIYSIAAAYEFLVWAIGKVIEKELNL